MSGWLLRHVQAMLFALGRLARAPFATACTLLVIALALALPAALALLLQNARAATGGFAGAIEVSVYFETGASLEKARELAAAVRKRSDVTAVRVVPADEALQEFRDYSGFGEALEALEGNPLPHVVTVRPTVQASAPAALQRLERHLAGWPQVELVQVDSEWVSRFNALLDLVRRVVLGMAVLLAAGVLTVIANTIRLEVQARRSEIEVTKLVGGTNGFVRRPFLYTGALFGGLGALLAFAIVAGTALAAAGPVRRLAASYGSAFELTGPGTLLLGELLAAGAVLGWLGAWIAASRHIARVEPRV